MYSSGVATVNVRTQEALEVLAVCLYHKEKVHRQAGAVYSSGVYLGGALASLSILLDDSVGIIIRIYCCCCCCCCFSK